MKDELKEYLAEIGAKGGKKSRRKLTTEQAQEMVRAREKKKMETFGKSKCDGCGQSAVCDKAECPEGFALCSCRECKSEKIIVPGSPCDCGGKFEPCDIGEY